ncbi:cystathionine beta-synthase-like [Pectinophora gossypiella]|uniref:cystathionine beta-synthase-like n=1 Tax=Pectinophora gossypiella TaxID=13191 RepID=UPI00214EB17A|nr:cystathionine beta-synthase-like [Pectinophora gossypiella]XP_049877698.1 cystathionine beta-synthase-like [Pectinophora gossypiella]XP_049877699.1 cystathionine beta-synthase-like [Pectinophora gossypiella]
MSNHVDVNGHKAAPNSEPRNGAPYFHLESMPHEYKKPFDVRKKTLDSILDLIGITPLIKLNKIPQAEGIKCDIYAKLEYENPGGSIKDRIAYRMVLEAEKAGRIKPGVTTLIEPTSGNTGIGLAMTAAVKGYRCIIVIPDKMSDEKVNTILALGAEVVKTPTDVHSDDPESNIQVAKRLSQEIKGSVILDQYNNPHNPLAHYDGTAEEILWATDGKVDMVVMGAGTSGTISGTSSKIKKECPECIIVGADPYGSILAKPAEKNKSNVTYYEVEGIGYDFFPDVLDYACIDQWVKTEDHSAFNMSRRLVREEGLLCGGSAGAAMWTALQAAKQLKAGQKCVVVLPDGIRNYMTKFVSDPWMEVRGFKPTPANEHCKKWWSNKLSLKHVQPVPVVRDSASTRDAVAQMSGQTPPPLVAAIVNQDGFIRGLFSTQETLNRLESQYTLDDPLKRFMITHYASISMSEEPSLGAVARALKTGPFIVILDNNDPKNSKPLGVMTSSQLLQIIARESQVNGN